MLKVIEFSGQLVDRGGFLGSELEFERQVVIHRFLINRVAALLHHYLDIVWFAAGKYARIKYARGVARPHCGRNYEEAENSHDAILRAVDSRVAWHIATASASLASSDSRIAGSRSNDCTISCTWHFSARP